MSAHRIFLLLIPLFDSSHTCICSREADRPGQTLTEGVRGGVAFFVWWSSDVFIKTRRLVQGAVKIWKMPQYACYFCVAPQLLLEVRQESWQAHHSPGLPVSPLPPCKLHSVAVWGSIKFVLGERGTLSTDPQAPFFILRLPVALVTNWWSGQDHYLGVPVTDTRSHWWELMQTMYKFVWFNQTIQINKGGKCREVERFFFF